MHIISATQVDAAEHMLWDFYVLLPELYGEASCTAKAQEWCANDSSPLAPNNIPYILLAHHSYTTLELVPNSIPYSPHRTAPPTVIFSPLIS